MSFFFYLTNTLSNTILNGLFQCVFNIYLNAYFLKKIKPLQLIDNKKYCSFAP